MKKQLVRMDESIYFPCIDGCTHLVLTRWNGYDEIDISFVDSRMGHKYAGFLGRLRRAWLALFGKPIYYAEVIMNEEEFNNFLDKARAFHNSRFGEPPLPLL